MYEPADRINDMRIPLCRSIGILRCAHEIGQLQAFEEAAVRGCPCLAWRDWYRFSFGGLFW